MRIYVLYRNWSPPEGMVATTDLTRVHKLAERFIPKVADYMSAEIHADAAAEAQSEVDRLPEAIASGPGQYVLRDQDMSEANGELVLEVREIE